MKCSSSHYNIYEEQEIGFLYYSCTDTHEYKSATMTLVMIQKDFIGTGTYLDNCSQDALYALQNNKTTS